MSRLPVLFFLCVLHVDGFNPQGRGLDRFRSVPISSNSSNGNHSIPDLPSLCPYNRFCQSMPTKDIVRDGLIPCCEKCSCDLKCYEIGNCCPDIPLTPTESVRYPCVKVSNSDAYDLWYHVIDDCKDLSAAQKYPQCFQPAEVSDLVLVSSPNDGRVYSNRHCALCNEVTHFTTWNLHIGCYEILKMSFRSLEERHEFIFRNRNDCYLHSVPPDGSISDLSRCVPDRYVIKTCNHTRQWDYYDKNIEQACHDATPEHNQVYIDPELPWTRLFANVYCYMCNKANQAVIIDQCSSHHVSGVNKANFPDFVALLDLQDESYEKVVTYKCDKGEIRDQFTGRCRQLICPPGTLPNYGKCKSILKVSHHYTVEVMFNLIAERYTNRTDPDSILDFLKAKLSLIFGSKCGVAEISLFNVVNSTTPLLRTLFYSTNKCAIESILMKAHTIASSEPIRLVNIDSMSGKYQIELQLLFDDYSTNSLEVLAYRIYSNVGRHTRVDSSILSYCPQVRLTRSEVLELQLNNTSRSVGLIAAFDDELTNNTLTNVICLDEYIQLRNSFLLSNSCSSIASISNMCMFIFICTFPLILLLH